MFRLALTVAGLLVALVSLPEESLRPLSEWLFPDMDLILAEGYHWLPLPRIEVEGHDGSLREAHPDGEVIARLAFRFDHRQIVEACNRVEARYLKDYRNALEMAGK